MDVQGIYDPLIAGLINNSKPHTSHNRVIGAVSTSYQFGVLHLNLQIGFLFRVSKPNPCNTQPNIQNQAILVAAFRGGDGHQKFCTLPAVLE